MERQMISEYIRGWNDRALGRAPRAGTIGYQLGYKDARKN
ncbi:hypothetical protein BTRA_2755 [Burkholderia thailandensis USAMRU Malaysia |uniref:Gp40-related protein n=1 Tax=Burkholderia thailandensis (strain ATCC 700388 / DSM 13276 / CCUG 48851 / CIP 106301 / E264) TaxID=271848 RepID=Q2T6I3_BURTA|nr:gp40-related protein [Burkholderia thailandensis E264]AHI74989.1 hypothetical protein BTQ_4313 [Burkholderia thailandensis 2002721723]AIC87125.1 hypothetical protein BTRA_2755 [Burkholderia thailandensis USAMRU Malaysia \